MAGGAFGTDFQDGTLGPFRFSSFTGAVAGRIVSGPIAGRDGRFVEFAVTSQPRCELEVPQIGGVTDYRNGERVCSVEDYCFAPGFPFGTTTNWQDLRQWKDIGSQSTSPPMQFEAVRNVLWLRSTHRGSGGWTVTVKQNPQANVWYRFAFDILLGNPGSVHVLEYDFARGVWVEVVPTTVPSGYQTFYTDGGQTWSRTQGGIYHNTAAGPAKMWRGQWFVDRSLAALGVAVGGTGGGGGGGVVTPPVEPPPAAANPVVALNVTAEVAAAEAKVSASHAALAASAYPHYTTAAGAWVTTTAANWTAGFFPGEMWDLFERLGTAAWRDAALAREAGIDAQKTVDTHDLGFMFAPFTRAFDLAGNTAARASALTAASTVSARWNDVAKIIRSWNAGTNGVPTLNTIIDSMMNMRLLFWAARNGATDTATLYSRAVAHAHTVQANHVRADGGTFHVVEYNADGTVLQRRTAQGYADNSTWARGQAWGLVGFVTAYEETRAQSPADAASFLATAKQLAGFAVARMPADNVPRWDYDAPATDTQKDTSAATITAFGLFRLGRIDPAGGWAAAAKRIMDAVGANYKAPAGWASVLAHGVSNKPGNIGVDVGTIYGDRFWLGSLLEYAAASTVTPAAPTGVQVLVEVTDTGKPKVTVTANPVAGLIAGDGYQVYRDGVLIAGGTAPLPSPSYVDTDAALDWAQTHEYRMSAGQTGRFGTWSDPVSVTLTETVDTTAPAAPGKPEPTSVTATSVTLSWPASPDPDVTSYVIERAVAAGAFATLATIDTTGYSDTGLTTGTLYTYRVKAVDAAGNTSLPGQTLAVTPAAAPAVPTGLAASSPQPRRVALTWTAVAGAQGYRVKRDGAVVAEGVTTNSFTDLNIAPGDYVYTVAAGLAPNVSADAAGVVGVAYGIRLVPPTLDMPSARVGDTKTASLFLTGRGSFAATDDAAWLAVAPSSGALTDTPLEVVLTATPTAVGLNTATLTLTETAPAAGGGGVPPVNTSAPTVTGTPQVGATLTGGDGTWSGSPSSFTRKWYRL